MTLDSLLVVSRFVHFAAAMLAFGAVLFPLYTGVAARFPTRTMALVALASGTVWFACTLVRVAGDPAAAFSSSEIQLVLLQTGFGQAWLVHLVLGVALLVATFFAVRFVIVFGAALNLFSLAWIGHAAVGGGLEHAGHLAVQVAHLGAGGVWLGALVPLSRALAQANAEESKRLIDRFSAVGYCAVSGVAVTGLLNIRFVTGAFFPSWSSFYGQLIDLKLGLVALLVAIAMFNQFYAARQSSWLVVRRGIVVELAVFAGILLVVGLLGETAPM